MSLLYSKPPVNKLPTNEWSFLFCFKKTELSVAVHTHDPIALEAEAGWRLRQDAPEFQPRLYRHPVSKKTSKA